MKKVVTVFVIAWSILCITTTGAVVTQQEWRKKLMQNPGLTQDGAGDAFNQGARQSAHLLGPDDQEVTVTLAEKDGLKVLSLAYWLYPHKFTGSTAQSYESFFSNPEADSMVFIGSPETFYKYKDKVPNNYSATVVIETSDSIFVVVKKS